jgi:lipopolysaccharide export system protein LptA
MRPNKKPRFRPLPLAVLCSLVFSGHGSAAPGGTNVASRTNESGARILGVTGYKQDEYFPAPHETQLKTRIEFGHATPSPQGDASLISQVKVQTWQITGEPDLIIETPECNYNSAAKLINSPGPLTMRTADGRFFIEGQGFTLFQTNSLLFISNRVHTIIHPALVDAAEAARATQNSGPSKPSEIEVFADHFRYSHESGVGLYENNVRVTGTNLAMTCGNAEVHVPSELRALQSIRATENVVMDYDMGDSDIRKIHATGDNALYLATNGTTTITGHPTWRADQREGHGDTLALDMTNKIFRVISNAFLKVPTQSLGENSFLPQTDSASAADALEATNRFVEVYCDHYLFETNFASFGDQVRVVQTSNDQPVGAMTSSKMFLYFSGTNQLQEMVAEQNVVIEASTNNFKADKAVYTGTNHLLALTGNPSWHSGDRDGNGDLLQVNVQNQEMFVFTNAFMHLPANQLGQSLSLVSNSRTNSPALSHSTNSLPLSAIPRSTNSTALQYAEITSEQYSVTTNSALFNGTVRVTHPRMDWACDRLNVESASAQARDIKMTAEHAVDFHLVDDQGRSVHGTCDKAVYTYKIASGTTNSTVTLTEHPVLESPEGTVTNSIIILDLVSQVISTPGKYRLYGHAASAGTNVLKVFKTPAKPRKR